MAAHGPRTVAAILVAGGSGARLGAQVPKAFVTVAGRTLLEHATTRFVAHPAVDEVVVVAPTAYVDEAVRLTGVMVVAGGATRQESVLAGLAAVGADVQTVLVHDVARPFVPDEVITAVIEAVAGGAVGAVPVMPIHDTVRRIDVDGVLVELLDRASMVAVQTPQGFDRAVLDAAHASGHDLPVTDDAALVEALGHVVVAVAGSDASFKITRPWDLAMAEALAGSLS